jgi:antitoxin VapB
MVEVVKARVFMSGRSQAVRIPAQYRFTTDEVYLHRDPRSGALTLSERPQQPSLQEVFAELDAAGGAQDLAHDLLLERSSEPAQEREWME